MSTTPTPVIFLSYSRRNRDVMQRVLARLRERGFQVWVDNEKLTPGTPIWEAEIESAITSAGAAVVLLSPDAKRSEWVRAEIEYAKKNGKRIYPVLVDGDLLTSVPLGLLSHQFVDLRMNEAAGLEELADALGAHLAPRSGQRLESAIPPESAELRGPAETLSSRLGRGRGKRLGWILGAIGVCLLGGCGFAGLLGWRLLVAPSAGETPFPASSPFSTSPLSAETPRPSATPSVTETVPIEDGVGPLVSYLGFSTNLGRWGIDYYQPESVDLSETQPTGEWIEPPVQGAQRLYGTLNFGESTQVGVILDALDQIDSLIVFAFDGDIDFSDNPVYTTTNGEIPDPIEFQISYADGIDQKYAISVYYPIDFAQEIGAYRFHYYRASVREGTIRLGALDYPVALADANADGLYSDLANTEMFLDADRDGAISEDERVVALSPFLVEGNYYIISSITESGSRMAVKEGGFGEIVGLVVDAETGEPIAGAEVVLSPLGLSAVSDADGRYRLSAPEGVYAQISAKADGYILNRMYINNDQPVAEGQSLSLDTMSLTSDTAVTARSGIIRLEDGESYHFLAGERYRYSGGDFYFGFLDNAAEFYANNLYQQGVLDLGDIGEAALDQVEIPIEGYYRFGVPAIMGHTYVSPAKEGEEGHYIVFRVTDLQLGDYIEIEFYYR